MGSRTVVLSRGEQRAYTSRTHTNAPQRFPGQGRVLSTRAARGSGYRRQRPATSAARLMQAGSDQTSHGGLRRETMERQLGVRQRPWQSPAVLSLAEKLSQRQSNILPMMVEGPVGTVLTAVGEHEDHKIAGSVLAHAQEQRVSNNIPMTRELAKAGGRSFGMVYEHRDAFGRPIYVGHSDGLAEERFAIDRERHQVSSGWLQCESDCVLISLRRV